MLIHGDCLRVCNEFQNMVPRKQFDMVFADPPDNLGLKYEGFDDNRDPYTYIRWLEDVIDAGVRCTRGNFWISYYHKYDLEVKRMLRKWATGWEVRTFIWRFTFGQHRESDFGSGYRPIVRVGSVFHDIREESERQRIGDSRASPLGRVPDDVFDEARVVGNAHERRSWHPTQHPEKLIERIILSSTLPGQTVLDMFGGTGTVHRVCQRCNRLPTTVEISGKYFQNIQRELRK